MENRKSNTHPQKRNTNDYNNYRPISVLNTCSKILERAVHKQLIDHLETNNLLSKMQFGYRKKQVKRASNDTVFDNIRKAVDEGHLVVVLYVNMSKAFLIH